MERDVLFICLGLSIALIVFAATLYFRSGYFTAVL
jgi:hypothetical protein